MTFECSKDQEIIQEVLRVTNSSYCSHRYFNDGAVSRVILLNEKYIIKQNFNLEAEIIFFQYNQIEMFQKVVYIDNNHRYIVYEFLKGSAMKGIVDAKDTLDKILNITSKYNEYDRDGYGYYLQLVDSWEEFLISEIKASSDNVKDYIKDVDFIYECVKKLREFPFIKSVIHGDFGTHNFIVKEGKMCGVIDPDTVIGDPLYDTLFAIVSNVGILKEVTYESLCEMINEDNRKIYYLMVIVLFLRISRCLKYHKNDIDIYMDFYNDLLKRKWQ